jgi:hypothetical protein
MVSENDKVEGNDKGDADLCDKMILIHTKNEDSQDRQNIFHEEETRISLLDEEVHERIDLLGSPFDQENRQIRIEYRQQKDEKQGDKQPLAVPISIQIGIPVGQSPNSLPAPEEHIPTEWSGRSLSSIPEKTSVSQPSVYG